MNKLNNNQLNEHTNKISKIIDRVESNHFKWYVMHLSILAFSITLYSFIFNLFKDKNTAFTIVSLVISGVSINLISAIAFFNSWKFLSIGRAFREMEKQVTQTKIAPSYNWKNYKVTQQKGFIFWTHMALSLIIIIISIALSVLGVS